MEKLYHYLWQTRLKGTHFHDVSGLEIEVIDPGVHNQDSGPDFFNSKVKIQGVEWVGNVEIHVKASDWYRHRHDNDDAYKNVILHVVAISDKRIVREDGSFIPQIEVILPESFFRTMAELNVENDQVRCARQLRDISGVNITDWMETLFVERMQQKAQRVLSLHSITGGDWEQTCFIMLARGLGFGLNGEPFEMLAKSVPLKILHHHSDNLQQLEAILFGQSAMLDPTLHMFDEYFQALCREYYFLARKYNLKPMRPGLWKNSRTRPQNFPHRRIAYLAVTALGGFSLFSRLLQVCRDGGNLHEVFDSRMEGYWKTHFSFDTDARDISDELSYSSKLLLAINVAIPLIYAYSASTGDQETSERVLGLMNDFPAENNVVTRQWKNLGIEAKDAARSQSLLHLKKEYCEKNKCIYCRFGHLLLKQQTEN